MAEFSVDVHAPKLRALQERGVYLGTSSWIYEGWIGQVYRDGYLGKRGAFSKTRFRAECLAEHARVFPTVCFDGAYYRAPSEKQLRTYQEELRRADGTSSVMAFKVSEAITLREDRAGVPNPGYLSPRLFTETVLSPIIEVMGASSSAAASALGPLILEFSPFFFGQPYGQRDYSPLAFVRDLHHFFAGLSSEGRAANAAGGTAAIKFAVEVRDPELLAFPKYLDCLEYHGVAHVLNEQTWMPEIAQQLEIPGIETAPFTVIRALVRPGVKHHDAVEEFEPYDRTQLVLPKLREALATSVRHALATNRQLYAYVNNRAEGNSPNTIASVLEMIG